ncbi:hypothetical protein EYZ11_000913 [Aspergillus tanneri]|uniref:catalase n=1 Tax=Aspergillus tanneri TaxID=1220188 RepID=A0A4S3JW18_9EURO|nr:hypothetical protein EYZ11_000913 [Aspergillus tanneri]
MAAVIVEDLSKSQEAAQNASSKDRKLVDLANDTTNIHRFDCERVPERVLYARGTGAFGNFQLLEGAEDVTYAGVLTDTSRNTPVFSRQTAIPRSGRMMQGFGANTFVPVNKEGKRHFVKFLWIPHLGVHSLVWDESLKLAGQDPDSHRKDLIEAIDNKAYPKWAFAIQVIPEEKQGHFVFAILVATKIWPEELVDVAIELHIANHTQSSTSSSLKLS